MTDIPKPVLDKIEADAEAMKPQPIPEDAKGRMPIAPYGIGTKYLHYDAATDQCAIEIEADVEPLLDANKARANDGSGGWSPSRELRHVATVDASIQFMWIIRYGADPFAPGNEQLLRRILNDPEWKFVRTGGGRI